MELARDQLASWILLVFTVCVFADVSSVYFCCCKFVDALHNPWVLVGEPRQVAR